MSILLKFLADYAYWVYGMCGVGVLWYLRNAYMARRERARAIFTLEREAATARFLRSITTALGFAATAAVVYMVITYLMPVVPVPGEEATPTPPLALLAPTATSTPAPPTATPTVTSTQLRPTRRPQPTPTPTATPASSAPPVAPPACPNPKARLTSPGVNAVVSGVISVSGSAAIENFQYYKLEFGVGSNPQEWSFIMSRQEPVNEGVLGTWDTAVVPDGVYTLRLVVVDNTGNYPLPCEVTIKVSH